MIWSVIIGIVAGFLAGILIRGKGFGCLVNLLIGIVGSVLGRTIFGLLRIPATDGNKVVLLAMSTVGAIVLLLIVSLFKRK
ncbi:MAG: GlsB/YeaQ/YmgE family stress response membrane protein [Flavobacteriaceae bacterium]|jgi:uncharacterized membrane protein YeaQ/YmgE (transglycosylase-associated protein family)|nr:GlsB/YeaQ/YmgE family stress response membrane protein [Flavobacteriaceae bacterium]